MCGIVGYIGPREASPILMEGLDRLSYRGYDSAGLAIVDEHGKINVRKAKGRLENLKNLLEESPLKGRTGIGHTRWATHGESELSYTHTDVKGASPWCTMASSKPRGPAPPPGGPGLLFSPRHTEVAHHCTTLRR